MPDEPTRILPCPRCAVPQPVDRDRCAACLYRFDSAALALDLEGVHIVAAFRVLHLHQDGQEILVPAEAAPRLLDALVRLGAWIEAASRARIPAGVTALPRGPGCAMVFGDAPVGDFAAASEAAAQRLIDQIEQRPARPAGLTPRGRRR